MDIPKKSTINEEIASITRNINRESYYLFRPTLVMKQKGYINSVSHKRKYISSIKDSTVWIIVSKQDQTIMLTEISADE
jgi:hypothetical protein